MVNNMNGITIRKAIKSDALNLSVLKNQVFISTYAIDGIREDFSKYISQEFSVEKIENELNDENKIVLLAENKEFLIACAEIDLKNNCPEVNDNSPELTVLYVFEHFKGKGVGYALISEAEKLVKEKGFSGLWLTVYHQNRNALSFYKRQYYKVVGNTYFELGSVKYENKIMLKKFS